MAGLVEARGQPRHERSRHRHQVGARHHLPPERDNAKCKRIDFLPVAAVFRHVAFRHQTVEEPANHSRMNAKTGSYFGCRTRAAAKTYESSQNLGDV